MMQSISHWGQFEMQAAGTENFRESIKLTVRDSRGEFTFDEWQKMPPEVPPPLIEINPQDCA